MKKNVRISDYKECPKCGSNYGWYSKSYAFGWLQDNTLFSGGKANDNMHDSLRYSKLSKYAYCIECNKRICKIDNNGN